METITLDQSDEKYVKNGIIESGGLGPCIAVAVFNPSQKSVWMIHDSNMDVDKPLTKFLEKSTRKIKNKNKLQVYAVGCSIDKVGEDEIDQKCLRAREYVEEVLAKWFVEDQITIDWGQPGDTTELIIDTITSDVIKTVNGETTTYLNVKKPDTSGYYDSNGDPL